MTTRKLDFIDDELAALKESGLFVNIRTIESAQDAWLRVDGRRVLNFCSNNYLGLANHPRLRQAAVEAIETYGVGPGAVRTIAGRPTPAVIPPPGSALSSISRSISTICLRRWVCCGSSNGKNTTARSVYCPTGA